MNLNEYFQIGKIGKAKSFKGEVFLRISDEEVFFALEEILDLKLLIKGKLISYPIEKIQVKNATAVVVKFKGIDDITMAELIKNCEVYIPKSILPASESEEVFTHEFIDCTVIDEQYGTIGVINFIDKSTPQMLAYLEDENGKEVFFPLVEEFITEIDIKNKSIHTQLPSGILEIND